jgi:hypothetical protein
VPRAALCRARNALASLATAALAVLAVTTLAAGGAQANPAGTTHYPDLQTVIPTDAFSVVQGTAGREFRYTHLVYNAGPGPLEIQPQYSETSGNYLGQQLLFTHSASNVWSQVSQTPVADAFVFHAAHGHFHFPLASFGLYAVDSSGNPGAPVTLSPKNGFCISDSYIYNSTVTHAGVFPGSQGSCSDPTTLRGMTVGAVDEYDFRDPGQAIPFDGIPDGTYWFRAMTDPNNDLVEGDESNNETDVKVTVSGSRVTAGEVRRPDTTPPPVTLTAPAAGARQSGTVTLTATTPGIGGVQFLVDGNPVGTSTSTASPYSFDWDSRGVPDGEHWIAARAKDAQGRTNTSAVARVNVANVAPPPSGGPLAMDASVSQDGRSAQTTAAFSTMSAGDLLLAFVAADGPTSGGQTATVSGAGLNWSLVRRANTRLGTSEIWKAVAPGRLADARVTATPASAGYDMSLHVVAFAGSAGVGATATGGATSGAPRVSLTTTADGSWVFGVGNDWDSARGRTIGADQAFQHQWVDSGSGDTFWMQRRNSQTARAGTTVTIDDTAPTDDQWNLTAVEVLAGSPLSPPIDSTPPQVTLTDPIAGSAVSGIIQIGAVASDNVGVTGVQFKMDGQLLGGPDTAPPFATSWDTRTASAGQHTLTAEATDAVGNIGLSTSVNVTVDNSAPPPATISVDTSVTRQARGTLTATALTTAAAGEQLVAFVGADGPNAAISQRMTVTGAGLTWTLVKRSDSQAGVTEIWTARATAKLTNASVTATPLRAGYDGLLHVIAFRNAAGVGVAGASGAPSGAPDIYLPGVAAGSWVFAVGNDYDRAVARTPVTGQVIQRQWVDTGTGDTFWVQSTATPNTALGLVTIHDNAPTNDRWNYAAVEVTAARSGGLAAAAATTSTARVAAVTNGKVSSSNQPAAPAVTGWLHCDLIRSGQV